MATSRDPRDALVFQFVADVLRHTMDCLTEAAHQQALQAFCDTLVPWTDPADLQLLVGQAFTLLEQVTFDTYEASEDETVAVVLSAPGEAVFRAWLRQRGLHPFQSSS